MGLLSGIIEKRRGKNSPLAARDQPTATPPRNNLRRDIALAGIEDRNNVTFAGPPPPAITSEQQRRNEAGLFDLTRNGGINLIQPDNPLAGLGGNRIDLSGIEITPTPRRNSVVQGVIDTAKQIGNIGRGIGRENVENPLLSLPLLNMAIPAIKNVQLKSAMDRLQGGDESYTTGRAAELNQIQQRISGKPAVSREQDEQRIADYIETLARKANEPTSVKIGRGVAQLPGFILDFWLAGGPSALLKKGIEKRLSKSALGFLKNRLVKGTAKVAGEVGLRTGLQPTRITESVSSRRLAGVTQNEDGTFSFTEPTESPLTSFFKGTGDVAIENLSEISGPGFKWLGAKITPKKLKTILSQFKRTGDFARAFEKVTGTSGFVEENLEEFLGGALRHFTGIADFNITGEELLIQMGVLAVPQIGRAAVSAINRFNPQRKQGRDVDESPARSDPINPPVREPENASEPTRRPEDLTQQELQDTIAESLFPESRPPADSPEPAPRRLSQRGEPQDRIEESTPELDVKEVQKRFQGKGVNRVESIGTPDRPSYVVHFRNGKRLLVRTANEIHPETGAILAQTGDASIPEDSFVAGQFVPGNVEIYDEKNDTTVPVSAVIDIAINPAEDLINQEGELTLDHEILHAAMEMGLNDREAALLTNHYGSEEASAQEYGRWRLARETQRQPGNTNTTPAVERLFQKIKDFWEKFLDAFRLSPARTRVFRSIESGRVFNRPARDPRSGRSQRNQFVRSVPARPRLSVRTPKTQEVRKTVDRGIQRVAGISDEKDVLKGKPFPGRVAKVGGGTGFEYIAVAPTAGKTSRAVIRFKLRDPKLEAKQIPGSVARERTGNYRYILVVGDDRQSHNLKTRDRSQAEKEARKIWKQIEQDSPELAATAREKQRGLSPATKQRAEKLAKDKWEEIKQNDPELAGQILAAKRKGPRPKGERYLVRVGGSHRHVGIFNTLDEAVAARDKAELQREQPAKREPVSPAVAPEAKPLADIAFIDVQPGVREQIEKRFADEPDVLEAIHSMDDVLAGDFSQSKFWTRFKFAVNRITLSGRKNISDGQRKAALAMSSDDAMSLVGQSYVDNLEHFARAKKETIKNQVNFVKEVASTNDVSVGEVMLFGHKALGSGAETALTDYAEFLRRNALSIDQILAARDQREKERLTAEMLLSEGTAIDQAITTIYKEYTGGVQFSFPLIANKVSENRGIAFMESFVDLLVRHPEVSPLTLPDQKRWDGLVRRANREGIDPFAFVHQQDPALFDKLALPWDLYRKSLSRIVRDLDAESREAFPGVDNLPTWVKELDKVRSTPLTATPQFIFNSEKLGISHAKALAENGPSAEHLELIERLSRTQWGARVTVDYSRTRRTGGGALARLPATLTEEQSRKILGDQTYDEATNQSKSLTTYIDTRVDRDSGRITITIHTTDAQASGQRLAEGIYAIIGEYYRQNQPGIYRAIETWHRQKKLSGHPLIEFAQAMALEEVIGPNASSLPEKVVKSASRLLGKQGNIPNIDKVIENWGQGQAKFSIRRSTRKRNVKGDIRKATGQVKDTTPSNLTERQALQGILKSAEKASKKGFRAGQVSIEANLQQAINFVKHNVPSVMQPKVIAALKGVRTLRGRKRVLQTVNRLQDQFEHTEALKKLEKTIKSVSGQKANKLLSEFRDQASGLLEGISLSSTSSAVKKRLDSLLRAARVGDEGIEGVSEARIKKVEGRLAEAGRKPIRNLTTEGVKELNQALSLLIQLNRLKKKLVFGNVIKEFQEFRNKIVNSLRGQKEVRLYRQPNDPDLDPEKGTLRTVLADGTLGPVETAQRIDGAEGGAMQQIMYDDPKNAERDYLTIKQEAEDLLRTTAQVVELDWDGAEIEKYSRVVAGFGKALKREVKLSNGQTLTMSPAELIFLHLSLRDLDTQEQILNTGIVFRDKDISNKTVPITIQDIITIRQTLTSIEMAFADSISHWLNSTGKKLTAEIFRQAGESRELREDYFYRVRSKAKTPQNIKLAEANVIQEVTGAGIFKERTGSGAPVIIDDVFLTFFTHVESVAKAHAYAMPIRNMKMVLGDPTIKRELTRVYGKQMIQYWMDRLIHISQLHTNRTGKAEQFMNRILGAFSKSVLGLNPSPRLKQFGGLFPASTELGGAVFTHYAASFKGKTFDKTVAEMEDHSPEFRDRYAKHAVHLTSNLFEDTRPLFGRQKLTDKTLNGLQKSDQRILVSLWLAAKEKIKNKNPGADEKAVLEKTARLTEKVVNNTQNITSILDMSNFALMSKSNPFTKPLALFKSNAERMQNMVRQAVWTYRKSEGSTQDVRKLVNVLAAVMIGNAGTSVVVSKLMRGLIGLIRGADGEDDKTVMEVVKDNTMEVVLENLGNYYLLDNLSRMVSAAFSDKFFWRQVAQGPFESLTVEAVESLKNLGESINAFYQDETFEAGPNRGRAKGPVLLTRGLTGLVRTASQLTGLPLFPVRALEAGLRRTSGKSTGSGRKRRLRKVRRIRPVQKIRRIRRTG